MLLIKVLEDHILRREYKIVVFDLSTIFQVTDQFVTKFVKVKKAEKALKRPDWPFLMKSKIVFHQKLSTRWSNFSSILHNKGENLKIVKTLFSTWQT